MAQYLDYEVNSGVATLTINRPEKRNAMTFAMLGDFTRMVADAGQDPETKVLIITGAPGAFCAGTDLADLASISRHGSRVYLPV
jgi:enoyl-CoA hydratase/carnithine racemase